MNSEINGFLLYQVAALNNSVEYRFAVTKNAQLIGRFKLFVHKIIIQ